MIRTEFQCTQFLLTGAFQTPSTAWFFGAETCLVDPLILTAHAYRDFEHSV